MKCVTADDAFTGLEAAIVLIAFVVVAAVFSYVVLSAGFFTTQKSQQVVQTSMQQASSSLEVVGNVYGFANDTDNLGYLKFTVANTAGESPIDVSKMVISYQDETTRWSNLSFVEGYNTTGESVKSVRKWGLNQTYNDIGTANYLLDPGEQFTLVVGLPPSAIPDAQITTNLQPAVGAVFQIKRTIPPALSHINTLF